MVWKVSGWYGKFPDGMDRFQMVWTVSRWSRQFPDDLESFDMAWKVSRWAGKFSGGLVGFQVLCMTITQTSNCVTAQVCLCVHKFLQVFLIMSQILT